MPVPDRSDILDLIANHYRTLGGIRAVETCGGFGVNSTNLKVSTEAGPVVVKCKPGESQESLSQQATVAQQLSERTGLPIPPFVRNSKGELVTAVAGSAWTVQSFTAGEYFTGEGRQLEEYLNVLVGVTRTLSESWADQSPLPSLDAAYESMARDFAASSFADTIWYPTIEEPLRSILVSAWPTVLLPAARRVDQVQMLSSDDQIKPCHIDLHPHNVLMADDQVAAILDWESLQRAPRPVFMGFSLIKMGRQAVAAGRDVAAVKAALKAACVDHETPFEYLLTAGAAEVLRRVHYVLTINQTNGDDTWNMVLPLLLRNLSETSRLLDSA